MKFQQIISHFIILFDKTKDLSNQIVSNCYSLVFEKNDEIIVYKKICNTENYNYIYLVFDRDHDLLRGYLYNSDGSIIEINKYQILLQTIINNTFYKKIPICFL